MLHSRGSTGFAVGLLMLTAGAPIARAQDVARSLEELRSRVKIGDRVAVTDVAGRDTNGTIAEVSPSVFGVMVDGTRIDFLEADLDSVSKRDSRWNGTLWGLAFGAAVGASLEKSLADEYGRDDIGYGSVTVPFAGLAAGIGFAVDALIRGQRVIYARADAATTRATVSPLSSSGRKGIFVSLRFR